MKTNYITLGVIAVFAVLFLTACGSEDTIKIGFMGPLTGSVASYGQNGLSGITLAVNEINANGGINGKKIQLIAEDDQCSSKSVTAIQKLINVDKIDFFLGASCSAAISPIVPILEENKIPTVLVLSSAPGLADGEFIFRTYPSDKFQGKAGSDFILNQLGKKKVAIIYLKDAWGEGITKVFKEEFTKAGGEILYESGVLAEETDLKTELTKVKETDAEVLFFPVHPVNAVPAFKQMKELNFNLPIVGGDSFAADEVIKSGYADNVMYSEPKFTTPEEFKAKIKAQPGFSNLDVNFIAASVYDEARVLAQAIELAKTTDKMAVKEALKKVSLKGVSTPLIEFDEIGELKKGDFGFKVIKDKAVKDYQ